MRKNAFTLAEVLITLVIIGVIAAMTIPTLMGSTNKQEIKTAAKKAYSALGQAITLEYALYGNQCEENVTCNGNDGRFAEMLKNHMSVIDSCMGGDCTRWKTADGIIYDVEGCCEVHVDVNGDKGNGQRGEDVFHTVIWLGLPNHHMFSLMEDVDKQLIGD